MTPLAIDEAETNRVFRFLAANENRLSQHHDEIATASKLVNIYRSANDHESPGLREDLRRALNENNAAATGRRMFLFPLSPTDALWGLLSIINVVHSKGGGAMLKLNDIVNLAPLHGELVLRIIEEHVNATLFLTVSVSILKDSTVYKKIEVHYDFETMRPRIFEMLNSLYRGKLALHFKMFCFKRSQLGSTDSNSIFWLDQVEKFYDNPKNK